MTDRKQALTDLLEKVEAGKTRVQIEEAAFCVWPDGYDHFKATNASAAFAGSLDAAKVLHEAVLRGWNVTLLDQACNLAGHPWGCEIAYFDGSNPSNNRRVYSGHDYSDPARAWLIAIIKALIAREGKS